MEKKNIDQTKGQKSQLRGSAQREDGLESLKKGEEFREKNQGRDSIDQTVNHPSRPQR